MNVLGLMSGSSLDGLDMALCQFGFQKDTPITHKLLETCQLDFDTDMVRSLQNATKLDAKGIFLLDAQLSEYIGNACKKFITGTSHAVDLIASHGHTVFHFPASMCTTQLGNGGLISQIAECDVVCDFRASDIGAGGLGAPCAPIADVHLFPEANLFLNIGGICNISSVHDGVIKAFDVSPANQLLNFLASVAGFDYDRDGRMSRKGEVDQDLLQVLLSLNNLGNGSPRALDNSWVQENFVPILPIVNLQDSLRTVVEFINIEIVNAIRYLDLPCKTGSILITGGGAFNKFLMEDLQVKLDTLQINHLKVNDDVINFKEAMLMALMGFMRWNRIPNVLKSVTGASRDTIGGCIYAY